MLQHGLYEQVVNVALKEALEDIPEARKALRRLMRQKHRRCLANI